MNFPPTEAIERPGNNLVFMVTMPNVKPSTLLAEVVFIGETPYRCIGLESRGGARPGNLVGLVVRPLKIKQDSQGQLF